ncbi:MAG: gliding motility protein GldN [Flavobacteriales bacterium]|nr:gliding motility protein GldN [Flavobacteriales bacterium]
MKRIIISVLTLIFCMPVFNSLDAQNVLDGPYIKEHTLTRKVVPYPHLREADVMWSKRIWQVIDLREKINHPLYYPLEEINNRKSLFLLIKEALLTDGSITAYSTGALGNDDEFKEPMLPSEVEGILSTIDTSYTEDLDTGEMVEVIQQIEVETQDVVQYKLKEDWFFDKQRSERYVRIIGLAPMRAVYGEDGEFRSYQDMFWLYFPECRYVFSNYDVFNRQNDAERRSFDDIFWKRQFNSYVVKESNVYGDRAIIEYATGIDALLESERIKEELFILEHDLWSY